MSPACYVDSDRLFGFDGISVLPTARCTVRPEILFESKFVALVLIVLKGGQRGECTEPLQRLLTIGDGRVRLHGPEGSFVLQGHVVGFSPVASIGESALSAMPPFRYLSSRVQPESFIYRNIFLLCIERGRTQKDLRISAFDKRRMHLISL